MKNLLNQFVILYENNDEFRRRLDGLQRMMETEEWRTLNDILITIKGVMATDMFSNKFTSLDAKEKDILQRTYYNIDQILTFLSKPLGWIKKRSRWEIYNSMVRTKGRRQGNEERKSRTR